MKGRGGLSSVRRLSRLLSISEGSKIGACSYSTQLANEVCPETPSRLDDSPLEIPSRLKNDFYANDKGLPSYFKVLRRSNSLNSSAWYTTLLHASPPASSLLLHSPQSLSTSAQLFWRSFGVSVAPFATLRERVLEDEEEEEEVGGHEKQVVGEPLRQKQGGLQTTDTGREAISEEQFDRNAVSSSDVLIGNEEAAANGHENEARSVRIESGKAVGWSELGWTREEVLNWPNAISMARLLSGPLLAWMILHEMWTTAFVGLLIAGISDWLDGYVARKMDINSVLGSYLDPVADKFLVGSVAVSMAYTGLLHPALVGLIVARDGGLMGGAFVYRAYSLGWQWHDRREFFRISIGGAGKVEPLFISKVNTVLQLALVGVALLQPALSIEDTYSLVPLLSWSVVVTTSMSGIAYAYTYLKNPENLAALRRVAIPHGPKASYGSASVPTKQ